MKPAFRYLIFILIFAYIAYTSSPTDNANRCHSQRVFSDAGFDGVLIDKFLDKSQHSIPVILIKKTDKDSVEKIGLFNEISGLFNNLSINDTIRKVKQSNTILVKVKGKYTYFGTADFKCDTITLSKEPLIFNLYKLFN